MTYVRLYKVNEKDETRFIKEMDGDDPNVARYLAQADKAVPSNKYQDTLCVYVREGKK